MAEVCTMLVEIVDVNASEWRLSARAKELVVEGASGRRRLRAMPGLEVDALRPGTVSIHTADDTILVIDGGFGTMVRDGTRVRIALSRASLVGVRPAAALEDDATMPSEVA